MSRALATMADHENAAAIVADRAARARRLQNIRSRVASAHGGFQFCVESGDYFLIGRDPVTREESRMASYPPDITPGVVELHASAFEDVTFLLELFDTACIKIRDLTRELQGQAGEAGDTRPEGPKADYAAEASMKCQSPEFVRYLADKHGLEDGADREFVIAALRKALKVESRKHLNTDPAAAARWRDMRADFEAWRSHG